MVASAVGLGIGAFFVRGHPPQQGDVVRLRFTLLPKDEIGCVCAQPVGERDHACQFHWIHGRAVKSRSPIAGNWSPHWTTDRMLYVVEGLWDQPDVKRVAKEKSKLPERDRRFEASCRVKLVRWLQDGKVKFDPRGRWDPHIPNWQVEVLDCTGFSQ